MMRPDQVWLNLIPLFNLVWMFITVIRVRDSVRYEFQSRDWAPNGDFGYGVGLAAAILSIVSWGPLGLAAFVCWIIYWVRTSELKNELLAQPPRGGYLRPVTRAGCGRMDRSYWNQTSLIRSVDQDVAADFCS